MNRLKDEFGALGNWRKIDEKFDENIVKQVNDASCVSAVGEMLARHFGLNLSQTEILENIGEWSNSTSLAEFLNSKEIDFRVEWIGTGFPNEPRFIKGITGQIEVWGAMLRDGETQGHAVLIFGEDENGLIKIKDPFDQTVYKMEVAELFRVLSELIVRRRKND